MSEHPTMFDMPIDQRVENARGGDKRCAVVHGQTQSRCVLDVMHEGVHRYGAQLPDPTEDRAGMVGRAHPHSAHNAAALIAPRTGTQREQALDALFDAADGLNAAQVAPFLRRSRNQTATRLLELRRDGWVEYLLDAAGNKVERPTDDNGNVGDVYVLTERGRVEWSVRRRARA